MQINDIKYTAEDLQEIANKCFDRTAFAKLLGWNYYNGKLSKKIDEIVSTTGISINHFDTSKKVKARRKYPIVKKKCPVCFKEFETQIGSKEERITCSHSCSNVYFASIRHTKKANDKASVSLNKFHEVNGTTKKLFVRDCLECKLSFQTIKEKQACCSIKCSTIIRVQNPEWHAKLSSAMQFRIANGTHKGWASRSKITPSFPEKVTMEILEELNADYIYELKCGKWFIDFAFVSAKIAIEIDGKQHELPERKASDEKKDAYLIANGWQVHRIKWKSLNKEVRKELKSKIQSIIRG